MKYFQFLFFYENNGKVIIINSVDKETNNQINKYLKIPREIFLLYKYNIESKYFNTRYIDKINLLSGITKIKNDHFINKVKNDDIMRYNIGLNKKDDILKIDQKSFLRTVRHEFEEMLKKERIYKDKNTSFVQQNFINKITILFDEIKNNEKEKKNFTDIWYRTCSKGNNYYSKILYLLKVLNCQLDIKNVITNNIALISNDNNKDEKGRWKDWNVVGDKDFSNIQTINPMNYSIQENIENIKSKFCFELNLNSDESIIKLIPINCYFTKFDKNFIVSISEEGVIRLHMILNEINKNDFQDIYTIKNCVQYKIKLEDNMLKTNNTRNLKTALTPSSYTILKEEIGKGHFVKDFSEFEKICFYNLRSKILSGIKELPDVNEGLENLIQKAALSTNSEKEFINIVCSKRYTETRIKRILLYSLLNITKREMDMSKKVVPYARVLGFNDKGKYLLSKIHKANPNLKVITSVKKFIDNNNSKNLQIMLDKDIFATNVYTLGYPKDSWGNLDFTQKIISGG